MHWLLFAFAPANPQGGASPWSMFVPIVGMLLIFYLLLIRPQQKRQKETQKMLETLRKGDRVVTSSGLYGTVTGVKDNVVVLKIAENVKVEMLKSAISGLVEKAAD